MIFDRTAALDLLAAHVYGPAPPTLPVRIEECRQLSAAETGGLLGCEQWRVAIGDGARFHLLLARPATSAPAPVILLQPYCGLRAALPGRPRAVAAPLHYKPWPCRCGCFDPFSRLVYGRHINAPPIAEIQRRGYALALFYGGDVVPDRAADAKAALARLGAPNAGAISAWAWMFSRALDALEQAPALDLQRTAAWGQSRQGKAALLAGARDQRFAAIIALQAGTGGDALTAHRAGESVAHIMRSYPHWFAPSFAAAAHASPRVDQDQLLAAIAPRGLLLGHARNDFWSDAKGAAMAMEKALAMRGQQPPWRRYTRSGWHGVTPADWRQTLDYLDHLFGAARPA